MRLAIQICALLVNLPLELLIIRAMLRGGYRRFPFIFAYIIIDFLTTVVELQPALKYVLGTNTSALVDIFWIIDGVMQLMVYLVVMSLLYQGTAALRSRRMVRVFLIAGAALIAGISFLVHYSVHINVGEWMTPWTRDLNFCAAILDLVLWTLLVTQRKKEPQLLMLSGGLGIQFTGEAIGQSLRDLAIRNRSRPLSLAGGVLAVLTNLLFLFIWWQAFRTPVDRKLRRA
jgi:hypothetical protein